MPSDKGTEITYMFESLDIINSLQNRGTEEHFN